MEVSRFAGQVTIPHRFAEPPLHKGAFLRGVGDAAPYGAAVHAQYYKKCGVPLFTGHRILILC